MIVLSTVTGVTIFQKDGEALKVAGPSGSLLALAIAGVAAISAVEGVSEMMIQMFPAPNAAWKSYGLSWIQIWHGWVSAPCLSSKRGLELAPCEWCGY